MTRKQSERSAYYLRESGKIAREVRENAGRKEFERVVRKTHEAVEMWLKGKLLEQGIEPAKIHDLNQLNQKLTHKSGISDEDLLYLTTERIPSFYGAEDIIPDQEYDQSDADQCLKILIVIGI